MARILIAWELGGGLGHLTPLVPIVTQLRSRGHEIFAVVRDLSKVDKVFHGLDVTCLQAPIKTSKLSNPFQEPRSFAHILHNNGFADYEELRGMAGGWRNLFDVIDPELIIFDHAPTALLASRTCAARRVVIGNGFCCPPDMDPFPDIRPWLLASAGDLRRDEDLVLRNANRVLDSWQLERLTRVSQLYGEVDHTFLTTLLEFDHYQGRGWTEYYGTWLTSGGEAPRWPEGSGRRIFAYLKPFKTLPDLLEVIKQTDSPTLVYVDEIDAPLRERFETPAMRFVSARLDLAAVGASCDLAILNGGHNVTCMMLLAGKPVMTVPLNLEQAYNGSSAAKLDAGFGAFPENPETFSQTLSTCLESESFRRGAEKFAAKYADLAPLRQIQRISEQIDRIARGAT